MSFTEELKEKIGALSPRYLMWSVDEVFEQIISDKRIHTAIEIGRGNGISTLVLAQYSDFVFSFDVANHNQELIWSLYPDLRKKVYAFTGNQEYIDFTVGEIKHYQKDWGYDFNFAFIDGEHSFDAVRHDYTLTKFCGRHLFHDVHGSEVARFVKDSLRAEVVDSNGYYGYIEDRKPK